MTTRGIRRMRTGVDSSQTQNQAPVGNMIESMPTGSAQMETGGKPQDLLGMLSQISQQLNQLQGGQAQANQQQGQGASSSPTNNLQGQSQSLSQGNYQQPSPNQGGPMPANIAGQSQQPSSVEQLQQMLNQLLQNGQAQGSTGAVGNQTNSITQQRSNVAQQGIGVAQQVGGTANRPRRATVVKTAAQALSEAQYELSVELENSLQKLKQVISESEKLADKISKILGEEPNASN